MKILKLDGALLDGGSINEIITDEGIFKLIKKRKGENNGFYLGGDKVSEDMTIKIQQALDDYYEVRAEDRKCLRLKEAVSVLVEALKTDESYRIGWQANIAMAFKDEYCREKFQQSEQNFEDVHELANSAADNFLNLLCEDATKN